MPFNRCIYAYMDLAAQPREAIAEIDRRYCILHASIKPKESEHRWLRFKKKKNLRTIITLTCLPALATAAARGATGKVAVPRAAAAQRCLPPVAAGVAWVSWGTDAVGRTEDAQASRLAATDRVAILLLNTQLVPQT